MNRGDKADRLVKLLKAENQRLKEADDLNKGIIQLLLVFMDLKRVVDNFTGKSK